MKTMPYLCAMTLIALANPAARAQEGPKPGPEHEVLKKWVGTWTFTMKFGDQESKGTVDYKMELGGMWLTSNLESELFGTKFTAKGLDTYDPAKKKYVSFFFDSMNSAPVVSEGTYDAAKKTLTMTGQGPGMDGATTKYKSLSVMTDNDTINFSMYIGDTKEPTFTIVYKRKK